MLRTKYANTRGGRFPSPFFLFLFLFWISKHCSIRSEIRVGVTVQTQFITTTSDLHPTVAGVRNSESPSRSLLSLRSGRSLYEHRLTCAMLTQQDMMIFLLMRCRTISTRQVQRSCGRHVHGVPKPKNICKSTMAATLIPATSDLMK